jgi:hypothetical protein
VRVLVAMVVSFNRCAGGKIPGRTSGRQRERLRLAGAGTAELVAGDDVVVLPFVCPAAVGVLALVRAIGVQDQRALTPLLIAREPHVRSMRRGCDTHRAPTGPSGRVVNSL